MANFIIDLEPDNLDDNQIQELVDIINDFELDDVQEERLAKMSTIGKNQSSKKWYRENKGKVKNRKERLERSTEGKKRERSRNQNRTPTGRNKLKYHRRKRSDRYGE